MESRRQPAALSIEITLDRGRYSLTLTDFREHSVQFHDVGDEEELSEIRRIYADRIGGLKRALQSNSAGSSEEMSKIGKHIQYRLLGDQVNAIWVQFDSFVRGSMKLWRQVNPGASPLLLLRAPAKAHIPIEALWMADLGSPPDPSGPLASYYDHLGYVGMVAHVFSGIPDAGDDVYLRNVPKLPIKFFQYAGLAGAAREAEFLRENAGVSLDGPWPSESKHVVNGAAIAIEKIYDTRAALVTHGADPDQVQHFSCHAQFDNARPERSRIRLGSSNTRYFDVSLLDMEIGFTVHGQRRRSPSDGDATPLVFLNACESAAAFGPISPASFPRHFLKCGSRAVIGTETLVPDETASRFSVSLYGDLLRGLTVGQAVLNSRRRLLEEGSALGILYTLFGDADLVVELP